jgi:hypothetical protein
MFEGPPEELRSLSNGKLTGDGLQALREKVAR